MLEATSLVSRPLPDCISQLWKRSGNGLGTRLESNYRVCPSELTLVSDIGKRNPLFPSELTLVSDIGKRNPLFPSELTLVSDIFKIGKRNPLFQMSKTTPN